MLAEPGLSTSVIVALSKPGCAGEGDSREERRHGHADALVLGGQFALGLGHVGAAFQQLR